MITVGEKVRGDISDPDTDKLKELVEGVCAAAFVLAIRLLHRIAFREVLSAASQRGRGF